MSNSNQEGRHQHNGHKHRKIADGEAVPNHEAPEPPETGNVMFRRCIDLALAGIRLRRIAMVLKSLQDAARNFDFSQRWRQLGLSLFRSVELSWVGNLAPKG